jgi:uncharacterized Fe-S cluster-containing protein
MTYMKNELKLPGLNCGQCGVRTCREFAALLKKKPELLKRCVHAAEGNTAAGAFRTEKLELPAAVKSPAPAGCASLAAGAGGCGKKAKCPGCKPAPLPRWTDSLGRKYDFLLEHFPEDRGPREIILPRNPSITKDMNIRPGDILLGRPLGMSCGCPVTHCGVATQADPRTGVMTWCVTGPLDPRKKGFKDIGFYSAEAYEGMIKESRVEIKIGMRYFFQPRMCMLQWRHSGLVNYINRTPEGLQVRLEGLWIG